MVRNLEPNKDYSEFYEGRIVDESAGLEILDNIAYAEAGKPILHSFQLDFADEGGMCEWCYVVDLDADVLEVYCGVGEFRMGRMGARPVLSGRLAQAGVTQQVLKISIPFIDLPGDKEELVKACTAGLDGYDEEW